MRRARRGFTLIEAMVAIAVVLVLTAIAVPSFKNASAGSELRSAATDLVASAHLARSEAIKRNTPVTMCVSSDGENCATSGGWEQGWIVRGDTTLRRQASAQRGLRITAGAITRVIFQPTGVDATPVAFTVCTTAASEARVVTINTAGRAVTTKATASCS
ncbi:MAG TPA: GspH/FimT family pseudopilin [Steroidobacter sp.]|uniref:GspH/FimT family pseudopilin n=1 Tax=Steroidobacter sp. TaxID=1978227 RepID=UPI002ED93EB6